MKVSIKSVRDLKESLIVELYGKVIQDARKSGDKIRIRASSEVAKSRSRLIDFFEASEKWKTKNGEYLIPAGDFRIVDAVSIFIQPESILTKLKRRFVGKHKIFEKVAQGNG